MAFGWYYPKVGKNTSTIYDPLNSLGWYFDCIWPIKKLKNVGMANFNKTIGNENVGLVVFLKVITYGAFTLDVKSMWNEKLGGILGGTQC